MKKLDPSIFKLKIYFVLNLKFYILIKPCLDERARCLVIVVFIEGQTKWRKSRAKRYKWRQIGNCGNTRHPHPRPQHSIVTLVTISFNALCHLINLWSTLRYLSTLIDDESPAPETWRVALFIGCNSMAWFVIMANIEGWVCKMACMQHD